MPGGSTEIIVLSMVASLVVSVAERSFAADNGQGAQLAATCAACHRLDGHDRGLPAIVGLSEEQFVTVMKAFKSGERSGSIMRTVARSLSNEEIAILARYFAARGRETQRR
jgi:cytochrome subunit of sulfide dehydrogenase